MAKKDPREILLISSKERVKFWKQIMNIRGIKKGTKIRKKILLLAKMDAATVAETARRFYSKFFKIKDLLKTYDEGTTHVWVEKIGRKKIKHTGGFPPESIFIAGLIRNMIINHESGIITLRKKKPKGG